MDANIPGIIGIIIGVVGTGIAAFAQYKSTALNAKVLRTEAQTKGELSQIEQALQSWKDINKVNVEKIEDCEDDCKQIRSELDEEKEKRHRCEINLAEMRGKVEVLMANSTRQMEIQNTQDLRQTERMDRSDVRQNNTDTRQDLSDTRQDKNDTRQTTRHEQQDHRQDTQDTEVLRLGDEVKSVSEELHDK